jgi:DMSO/TMAO reductase YedYZ molybdopterin-dependent catalytic subunit/frataxin-like iron-binding protein CyaY
MILQRLKKYGLGILLVTLLAMLPVVFTPAVAVAEDPAVDVLNEGNAPSTVSGFTYDDPGTMSATVDVIYDGTVTLDPGKTFTVNAYNTPGSNYTINEATPLGALHAASIAAGFIYEVTDKNYGSSGALLLDNVGDYHYVKGGSQWYAYVNDVFKDGYNNPAGALNLIELVDGDRVEFYYANSDSTDYDAVKAAATAAVKTVVSLAPAMDVLYDGEVALTPGETFSVTAYNSGKAYTVSKTTPLGALHAASIAGGFTYAVTDKKYGESGALLLDDIGDYPYVKGGSKWLAYVNGEYKDGYDNPAWALNLIELVDGDKVEFYYAAGISDPTDLDAVKAAATAAVKTVAATGVAPTDWTLQLTGVRQEIVTRDYFEQGLACSPTHRVSWTDEDDNVWEGMPLWLLVGMVDDETDGAAHFSFNDELADQHYEVNVIAGDGWKATFDSAAIARNDGYIVANTLNGEPLPEKTESGKGCWPLHLKGSAVFGGQQVGNIARIELSGLPAPQEGWTLELLGDVGDTITQEEFEEGLACTGSGHYQKWTDNDGNVWSGVPLWVLLGAVDDIENGSHWTFNDSLAATYTVKVTAGDGFSKTFNGADVAKSNDYIVANECNGVPLTGESWPLRLVGAGVTKEDGSLGGSAVGNIVKIEIPELQTPEAGAGSWNLTLKGKISDVISQAEFDAALACPRSGHLQEWTDGEGNVWSGIPLWLLAGWVDDRQPHDYDANLATAGYTILVKAGDGYTKDFASGDVAGSNDYIIANKCNGEPLSGSSWPLRLVGAGVAKVDGTLGGTSVGNIAEIELTDFGTVQPIPELRIIKYAEDGVTILAEKTVNYKWMENESGFDVIGDGKTVYRFEGITNNPDDIWDADETYPGGFKIENAVKGTRIRDLCELVGGMGAGTEIILVASDGYETRLPYSSIYPDPSVQARQGDAVLAWWADGKYVPDYKAGMRLFFTPDDCIYGQWDMHETLPENYWHYYYGNGVMYPSCAGLSVSNVVTIKIFSVPQGDWTLKLDGRDIGGLEEDISKTYFESALSCQFGANHKAAYTDSEGHVWEGMPLWFLAGFVDDADMHSDHAFNNQLAEAGYQVVITAEDGYSVTIDSADIIRNSNYIVANTLDGNLIPESSDDWPLRLVGTAVTGGKSISQIVRIELVESPAGDNPVYTVTPEADDAYTTGTTQEGINTMTVNDGVTGFKYFTVNVAPVTSHDGNETVVFAHFRNGSQLGLNATRADFDQVETAQAGFNVQPGDVVKVYIVDNLTNDTDKNPVILQ